MRTPPLAVYTEMSSVEVPDRPVLAVQLTYKRGAVGTGGGAGEHLLRKVGHTSF